MSQPLAHTILASLAIAALALAPCHATCVDPNDPAPLASVQLGMGPLSPPGPEVPHRDWVPSQLGRVGVVQDEVIRYLRTSTLELVVVPNFLSVTTSAPSPIQLQDSSFAVFQVTFNGLIVRIDPVTGEIVWSRNLRPPTCSSFLLSPPVVHLRHLATPAFQAAYTTDLVYVGTMWSEQCPGYSTMNKVYALRATDGAEVAVFNNSLIHEIDRITEAVRLDVGSDMLYFGSERDASVSQHTLWALDVLNLSIGPVWSVNAGPISSTPGLVGGRVYVARAGILADVQAYDKDTGAHIWAVRASSDSSLRHNIFAGDRPPLGPMVAVVNYFGRIIVVRDFGGTGAVIHDITLPGGVRATSTPVAHPEVNKLYVGADDGRLYQINMVTGAVEASREIDPNGSGSVNAPAFVREDTDADGWTDDLRILASASQGRVAKFCAPWAAPFADADIDGVPDDEDCDPYDPDLKRPPVEVSDVVVGGSEGSTEVSWESQGATAGIATRYDVVTGLIGDLTGSGGYSQASCAADDHADAPFVDANPVGPGEVRYWLVRATNDCFRGEGTYGDVMEHFLDPIDALDADSPCP